jgi:hypothetical protein
VSGAPFEVLDALDGFARLEKRSPLLDGQVPIRAAQGCVPLLEGNAFGFQVVLREELRARGRLSGLSVELEPDARERLAAAHAAAIPRLVAEGLLREKDAWHRRLRDGPYWVEREGLARFVLRLWTGLLVRTRGGAWLRVASVANRRNRRVTVRPSFVADERDFVPLVLEVALDAEETVLTGEVACVAPLRPGVRVEVVPLAQARELGAAHAAFYDERYFHAKKGRVTKKYRKLVARDIPVSDEEAPVVRVAQIGPARARVKRVDKLVNSSGPEPVVSRAAWLEYLVFENEVAFEASYDGFTLEISPRGKALALQAAAVERAWLDAYGEASVERDRRALWYLTKYFTPHLPGEPHFFVKPRAFTSTPPGWSSLVDGVNGRGYDVLRGVVATDRFFATPAVFELHGLGRIEVGAGEPLLSVFAVPRDLAAAGGHILRQGSG